MTLRRFPWVTTAVAAAVAVLAALSRDGKAFEYDRAAVEAGAIGRLLTGQLVHWTLQMAIADVGVLICVGAWVEGRSRLLLAATLVGAALLTAAAVHLLMPGVMKYRGSSGLASAVFVVAALDLASPTRRREPRQLQWVRWTALASLGVVAAKCLHEIWTDRPWFAGPLPAGVAVVPLVHLLGGVAGGIAFAALRGRRRA